MRRAFRWAWNWLSAASLVVSVAACLLWVRSYAHLDALGWFAPVGGTNTSGGSRIESVYGRFRGQVRMDATSEYPIEWRSLRISGPTSPAYWDDSADGDGIADTAVLELPARPWPSGVLGFNVFDYDPWSPVWSSWKSDSSGGPARELWRVADVPHWFVAAVFAVLPAVWLRRRRRARSSRAGGFPVAGTGRDGTYALHS